MSLWLAWLMYFNLAQGEASKKSSLEIEKLKERILSLEKQIAALQKQAEEGVRLDRVRTRCHLT